MSIATICLAIACALPIVCTGLAKRSGVVDRSFDNNEPRAWLAKQTGAAARANAAQANSWEALAVFAAGVLSAQHLGAPSSYVDVLAITFVVARVVYIGLYMADLATLRSVVWFVGYAASMALFFTSVIG
ncbi:MAG: MAPEG family protein [Deltaproteobacteria bacterium]|nr:MAPEG family protein [Deltaproteobacteria bacterium]